MANDINKEDPHYKGEYGSIYEVNRKFPTGGVAGDFVVIDGWAHYWNADRGTWCVNAERDSYWDELITNIIEKFKLVKCATYMGVASLDTVPTKVIGAKMYYFATIAGTYKNFDNLVVPQGINVLYSENGISWINTTLLEVAQELGVSTNKVVSQKTLNDALAKKFDKESIVQEFGDSEDKVVSQFALPFREIESPEFIKVIVDANDHLLFTINLDGEVDWEKGIPAPIKAKFQDIINQCQQDKTDLLGILDKTTIKDEEGIVFDTPFRYIQNEEFIFAKVDANDKLLFGIQCDGTPVFGKTSAVEDRLQSQVTLLAEKVATIMGDEDTTNVIDTMNEFKTFFANIENTQSLTDILANFDNVAKNLDKTTIKNEEGNVQDTPFRVIENEEFIKAIVDAEDRVLFGFYRETGEPYYPLNEMYHVIQNEEYFAAWLDADDKVLLGIRRDGEIIGEIHAANALKQVISQFQADLTSLQEKVGTIDANLKELLDVFSFQENPEYMAVEKDADGKVLAATYNDGSHYSHNLKSETIDAKVDKEEGKSLINEDVADAHSTLEDPEGRTEITVDADSKVISYRDADGKKHEHDMEVTNLDVSNLNLKGNSVNNIQDALKANGFSVKTPIDWSDNSEIQISEPRLAFVNITNIDSMPTSKTQNKHGIFEFWDMQGNYFKKKVILNAQGNSSLGMPKKNFACDFCNDDWEGDDTFKIKIGSWVPQDSFHFKAFYADFFKGVSMVGYKLFNEIESTRSSSTNRVWKRALLPSADTIGYGTKGMESITDLNLLMDNGARCYPDGFPCIVYLNGSFYGVFSWALKKHRDNYMQNKSKPENIQLDGDIYDTFMYNSNIDWDVINGIKPSSVGGKDGFEFRNPKSLICIDGTKYDADTNRKELIDSSSEFYDSSNKNHILTNKVKEYYAILTTYIPTLQKMEESDGEVSVIKSKIQSFFDVDSLIDYLIFSDITTNTDGFRKNWQWVTYNGIKWAVCPYDLDGILGWSGWAEQSPMMNRLGSDMKTPTGWVIKYFSTELNNRYKSLRKNILTVENILNLLKDWCSRIGVSNFKKDLAKYPLTPEAYNVYKEEHVDNIYRVENWLKERFIKCDNIYSFNN